MKSKLDLMNDAKANKTLGKLICYNDKAITKREWLNCLFAEGYKTSIGSTCPIKYNRVKYNSMNEREQKEYDKRLSERVTEYRAINKDGLLFILTKTEWQYLDDLCTPYASEDELNHLFGIN